MLRNWTIDDFELGKPLGRGKFGRVWLARDKFNGYVVALKIIYKAEIRTTATARQIRREIEIHSRLRNPNIVRMYGYFYDSEHIYIILEYASGGEFFALLRDKGKFSEDEAAGYVLQIAKALHYLHSLRVIHRDLKPENMLIGTDNLIKIADLGWAVVNVDNNRFTYCGTPEYLAPEMINNSRHDARLDLWCLGILAYELLVGTTPFQAQRSKGMKAIYEKVKNVSYRVPDFVSREARSFIDGLIVGDMEKRMGLDEVVSHRWIVKHCGLHNLE